MSPLILILVPVVATIITRTTVDDIKDFFSLSRYPKPPAVFSIDTDCDTVKLWGFEGNVTEERNTSDCLKDEREPYLNQEEQ